MILSQQWDLVLGCNIKSLSYFRITLSILLTIELLLRYEYIHAFYSNEGILPTSILNAKIDSIYKIICIHNYNGSMIYQQIVLGMHIIASISLGLGYQSRICAGLCWFLYLSLTLRNTWLSFILDRYIHYLLFYCIFLPISEIYSIDSYMKTNIKNKNDINNITIKDEKTNNSSIIISASTILLKLQILWIYVDAGLGKYSDPAGGWTLDAIPLPALDTYARHTVISRYLYGLLTPIGLRYLTPTVVYIELGAVPCALLASYFRNTRVLKIVILLICSLHIGIALTIKNTYLLSSVACISWWIYYHPTESSSPVSSSSFTKTKSSSYIQLLFILPFIIGSIWFEQLSNECTQSMEHIWSTLLHNRWNVFTGAEEYVTWEIAPGKLYNGMIVDVWSNTYNVSWFMPGTIEHDTIRAATASTTRKGRWRSYPYLADFESDEEKFLTWNYLCKQWNMEHASDYSLQKFNFFMLQADTLPNMGFSSTRKRLIHSHVCSTSNDPKHEESSNDNSLSSDL